MNLSTQGFIKCIATVRSNITILSSKIGVISNGIKPQIAANMDSNINKGIKTNTRQLPTISKNISSGIANGIKTQVAPRMKTAIKVKIGSVV